MTGEMDFAIPVMLAVVLSVLVSSKLTSSIFDRISKLNGLPNIHLPRCDITEKVRLSPRHSYRPLSLDLHILDRVPIIHLVVTCPPLTHARTHAHALT